MKILVCVCIVRSVTSGLKYRYYTLGMTVWAKMHRYLRISHGLVLGVNKRTRFKLIQNITFSLGFKIFELCNFCFEKHYLFVARANSIAKSKAVGLKCD